MPPFYILFIISDFVPVSIEMVDEPQYPNTNLFPVRPIPASSLALAEIRRRDEIQKLGYCQVGCSEIDGYVLLGGLDRGCVVGISSEEEDDFGLVVSHEEDTLTSRYILLTLRFLVWATGSYAFASRWVS